METKGGVDGSRVWLPEEIKEKLEKLKVHHRQAYCQEPTVKNGRLAYSGHAT